MVIIPYWPPVWITLLNWWVFPSRMRALTAGVAIMSS